MDHDPSPHPAPGFRQHLLTLMGIPAQHTARQRPAPSPATTLSDREQSVLRLLRGTLTNTEIAATLNISPNTLKTHIRHLYRKLGATTRSQAITRARELNPP